MKLRILLLALLLFTSGASVFSQEAVKTVHIKVLPGLQFDIVRFHVKPGTKVKLVFTNTDEMEHNLLVTKPGSREEVVTAALQLGGAGPAKSYIPEIPQVLWSIPVLTAEQTGSVNFTAPKQEGVYPYVCTFPGHGFVMYGAMYVSATENMPEIAKDTNIPPNRRTVEKKTTSLTGDDAHSDHKTTGVKDVSYRDNQNLYRVYIEGASPAAIAVRLSEGLSYCWDAGISKLRFAWKGGFVDNSALWKGHKDAQAHIIGEVFYRDRVDFPIRINEGDRHPEVEYKGYRLIDRLPEFHYTVNGVDVYEFISAAPSGNGLIRKFRIPESDSKVWFSFDASDGVHYQSSVGEMKSGRLELSAQEAKEFSITMIEQS